MLRTLTLSFCALVALAGPVRADFCDAAHAALTYEGQLLTNGVGDDALFRSIKENAIALERLARDRVPPLDPTVLRAVTDYTQNVARIHDDAEEVTQQRLLNFHLSWRHRVISRDLLAGSSILCDEPPEPSATTNPQVVPTTPPSAPRSGPKGPLDLPLETTVRLGWVLTLLIAVPITLAVMIALQRRRKRLRARHYCDIPVHVAFWGGAFETRLVDISAVGVKIELPEGTRAAPELMLTFAGRTTKGKTTWQNPNFAGVLLQRALPLEFVKSIAEAEVQRRRADRRDTPDNAINRTVIDPVAGKP